MDQTVPLEEASEPLKPETRNFVTLLESLPSIEEKLRLAIQFMKEALALEKTPNFKGFWDVRKICLPLFRENLAAQSRAQLWGEYVELTREGRRLKNLLDEESAFAVEQIELAIQSLENEIKEFSESTEHVLQKTPAIAFPPEPRTLSGKTPCYEAIQKKLNLLNVYAGRINSLRKELIHTEMRIRQKNKFFQSLSALGDQVFPIRRDLIKEVSEMFISDVGGFVASYFAPDTFRAEEVRRSVFQFREEIKMLQAFAKLLTLNTHAFSKTREDLSGCWDKLKGMEKELKREYSQHKLESSENYNKVWERIQSAKVAYTAQGENPDRAAQARFLEELNCILKEMRELELTRQDVRILKEEIAACRAPAEAQALEEEKNRLEKEAAFEKLRKEKIEQCKQQIEALKEKVFSLQATSDLESVAQEVQETRKNLAALSMTKGEKQFLERALKVLSDQIVERKEQILLTPGNDTCEELGNLKVVLEQKKERRREIKAQIEEYRRLMGGSGLDFEKGIHFNELLAQEKERLCQIDASIAELEMKIKKSKGA